MLTLKLYKMSKNILFLKSDCTYKCNVHLIFIQFHMSSSSSSIFAMIKVNNRHEVYLKSVFSEIREKNRPLIGRPDRSANQRTVFFLVGNYCLNSCPDSDLRKKKLTLIFDSS